MRIFAFLVAALLAIAPASANSPKSWTGCYAGLHGGYSVSNTETSIDATGFGSVLSIDGLGASGAALGVTVGCDYQVSSQFVIGAWGDYTWHDQTWSTSSSLLPGTLASVEVEQQFAAGVRAGYLVNSDALIYGLVGYSRMEMGDISVPAIPVSFSTPDFDGWILGGGVELRLAANISIDARYTVTLFDKESIELLPGVASLGLEPETHTGRIGVNYRF